MIELANDVEYGLAAGILTQDLTKAHQCAKDIEAGNIWVNTYNDFPAGQPFGGYKESGIGRERASSRPRVHADEERERQTRLRSALAARRSTGQIEATNVSIAPDGTKTRSVRDARRCTGR